MNRRKFLKIFGLSPLAFVVPSILLMQKGTTTPIIKSIAKQESLLGYPTKYISEDGGYFMPTSMVMRMQSDFHNSIMIKKFKISMMKRGKIRR